MPEKELTQRIIKTIQAVDQAVQDLEKNTAQVRSTVVELKNMVKKWKGDADK